MMATENSVFYNPEVKERYLEQFDNEKTRHIYQYPMKKASKVEREKGKDIYEMNLQELSEVFYVMRPTTLNAAYHNFLRIDNYIDFAIRNGLTRSNISPLAVVGNINEFCQKFVASYMNIYFTRDMIEDMVDQLINYTDQALLLSIFEGINGKGYAEIINMKREDIQGVSLTNEKPKITLTDSDGSQRTITITSRLSDLLRKADTEADYVSHNGEKGTSGRYVIDYENTGRIFKRANRGARKQSHLNEFFVQRKFAFFKDMFDMEYLKAKNIRESGMMDMAHQLYQERGVIGREELIEIGDKYNVFATKADSKGTPYRNVARIREVLSLNAFNELYGYELKFK